MIMILLATLGWIILVFAMVFDNEYLGAVGLGLLIASVLGFFIL